MSFLSAPATSSLPSPAISVQQNSHPDPQPEEDLEATFSAAPDWAPAQYIYFGWPTRPDVWRDSAAPARAAMAAFVRAAAPFAAAAVVVVDGRSESLRSATLEFKRELAGRGAAESCISVSRVDMDDCWLRDTGPVFCFSNSAHRRRVVAVSFDFNAWGGNIDGCYSSYARDRGVGAELARLGDVPCRKESMVLEGGSVSFDGCGTLITTEECLLRGNRNPSITRPHAERTLLRALGARTVIWLPYGAARDSDTNGHVDNMCVFIAPSHVLLLWADAASDPSQHARSAAALEILSTTPDARGRILTVHRVHAPASVVRSAAEAAGVRAEAGAKTRAPGERLAASYVNLTFIGDAVLVPRFGDERSDARAIIQIRKAFAAAAADGAAGARVREVVGVDAREFVLGGGGMHCLTVAQPALL